MNYIGKSLVIFGIAIIIIGAILMLGGKISWLGRLPGDIIQSVPGYGGL